MIQKPVPALIIILIVAAGFILGQTVFYYKGVYHAPQQQAHDFTVDLDVHEAKEYQEPQQRGEGVVLFDQSHTNDIVRGEFDVLFSRILSLGGTIKTITNQSNWNFQDVDAIIISTPAGDFSEKEVNKLLAFEKSGGRILLLADPDRKGQENMKGIGLEKGFLFNHDYLYNQVENDGNFRHIIVRDPKPTPLTKGITEVGFYVACSIDPWQNGIFYTDEHTYSSLIDVQERHTPLSMVGNIAAICDVTFLSKPYSNYFDNNQFITNIAQWLIGAESVTVAEEPEEPLPIVQTEEMNATNSTSAS